MKKKIFGSIAIVVIAVAVAMNLTFSNQNQNKANMLALANVEALAEGEDEIGVMKVNCKQILEYEEITYAHAWDKVDIKYTNKFKETSCIGEGSISCIPEIEILGFDHEFVECKCVNN